MIQSSSATFPTDIMRLYILAMTNKVARPVRAVVTTTMRGPLVSFEKPGYGSTKGGGGGGGPSASDMLAGLTGLRLLLSCGGSGFCSSCWSSGLGW